MRLLPPFVLLLCLIIYLLFSYFILHVCAYVSFPRLQCETPEGQDSLMFLWIPHSAWHHAIPAAWHSIG